MPTPKGRPTTNPYAGQAAKRGASTPAQVAAQKRAGSRMMKQAQTGVRKPR